MDNVSNCNVLARVLGILLMECYGMEFHSNNMWICCLAHIVNIVVQTLLKQLNEAEDPEILDWFEGNRHLPVHYNGDEDEEVKAMEAEDLVAAEDGRTEIDEILEDELPKDASSLSVVKKVSLAWVQCLKSNCFLTAVGHHQQDSFVAVTLSTFQVVHEEAVWWGGHCEG